MVLFVLKFLLLIDAIFCLVIVTLYAMFVMRFGSLMQCAIQELHIIIIIINLYSSWQQSIGENSERAEYEPSRPDTK